MFEIFKKANKPTLDKSLHLEVTKQTYDVYAPASKMQINCIRKNKWYQERKYSKSRYYSTANTPELKASQKLIIVLL